MASRGNSDKILDVDEFSPYLSIGVRTTIACPQLSVEQQVSIMCSR
jgi:hypothetical protein